MHGPQRKMLLSVSVIAVLGASVPPPVAAQPSPADRAAQRATMFQNMQNMRNCQAEMARANQAGATDADRVQLMRDCAAKQGQTFQPNEMQRGIELEQAGRYAEAAAAYQAHLNASGHPDGDGYVAGERLGFMYANGRGVPKDVVRARTLFSANSLDRNRIDLILLENNLLPATPEGKTSAVIDRANAIVAEQQRRAVEQQARADAEESRKRQAWLANHPEAARAQSCRASCAQAVQDCKMHNLGNFGSIGGWSSPNLHCEAIRCSCN
jgi:hypothetical protein